MKKKKITSLILAALLATASFVSLTACGDGQTETASSAGEQTTAEASAGMENPWVDCATLTEAIEKAGFDFQVPEGSNAVYRALPNEMIEVIQNVDGKELVYRKSPTDGDNSGDLNQYPYTGGRTVSGIMVILRGESEEKIHVAYFTAFDGTYSIGTSSDLTDKEAQALIKDLIQRNTK